MRSIAKYELYEKFLENLDVLGVNDEKNSKKNPEKNFDKNFVISLSGGVDSIVLMDLFAKKFDNPRITAITVDHKLRNCSSEEAIKVGEICKKYNIKHVILEWNHDEINSNVQEKARKARYKLISEYCKLHNIKNVFTGHHLDDRVENFFIKLSRGSGLMGLADKKISDIFEVKIIRPLYNVLKEEIAEYAAENKLTWFEDESNKSDKYLRNDIRSGIDNFLDRRHIDKNLFKRRIASTQDNLGDFASIIIEYFEEKYQRHVNFYKYEDKNEEGDKDGDYFLIKDVSEIKHKIILQMILEKVLTSLNKADKKTIDKKIRSSSISEIINSLGKNFKKTLNGCILIHKNNEIKIKLEPKELEQK
jgi:tRNA(Ile)-lysidine synthetase-like protein